MRDFRGLIIWKQAVDLAVVVYGISKQLPKEELYGLRSQVNRAVCSISSNIAEGCSRSSQKDFKRFLEIALGSAMEVENHLIICVKLNFISQALLNSILPSLHKEQMQINSLINTIKAENRSKPTPKKKRNK